VGDVTLDIRSALSFLFLFRSKAVSDGAVSFRLDHLVGARVSKLTYGMLIWQIFMPEKPDHQERSSTVKVFPSGDLRLPDHFDIILPKVGL